MKYFDKKNVLIISPESWGLSFLSKHHYALLLAESGNHVWFLNSFHNPTAELPEQFVKKTQGRLKLLKDESPRGIRFMPTFIQKMAFKNWIRKIEKSEKVKFDVVWSFDNTRLFHLDCFDCFRIHHVVDIYMNFHLAEACRSADLCLGVTGEIVEMMKVFNSNAHLIRHGFRLPEPVLTDVVLSSDRPKAAYLGNFFMKTFDAELLLKIARDFPQCDFILIGATGVSHLTRDPDPERLSTLDKMKALPNVKFVGERSYDEAFSIVNQCDIMLMMHFNLTRPYDNASKLMSYVATGKVTVSNPVVEYASTDLLCIAKDRQEFPVVFGSVLANLSFWNSSEKAEQRRKYADKYQYKNVIGEIENLILQTERK